MSNDENSTKEMKILILEDEKDVGFLLKQLVLRLGNYDVSIHTDALSALEAYKQEKHNFIIADIAMPGMDGFEFCRRVRALPEGKFAVILVVTGVVKPLNLHSVLDAGADDYISKPVEFELFSIRFRVAEKMVHHRLKRRNAEKTLRQSYEELEEKIEERTAELRTEIGERKRVEKELRRSEKGYRELFENAHDAIIVFEAENEIILDVNEHASTIYGFSKSEMIGMSLKSITKDGSNGKMLIKKTLEEGHCQKEYSVHYKKDGEEMYVQINSALVTYNDKTAIMTINRDITQQKKAQQKLRESEEKLRYVTSNIQDIIYSTDGEGRLTFVSGDFRESMGDYYKEIIENSVTDSITATREMCKNLQEVYGDKFVEHFKKQINYIAELEVHNKPRYFEFRQKIFFQRNPDGDNPAVIDSTTGVIRDVTERREAEEKLRKSEQKYRWVTENIHDVIFATDEQGEIIFVSGAHEQILGKKKEEIIGNYLDELTSSMFYIPPNDFQNLMKKYEQAIRRDVVLEYEIGIERNGEVRYLEYREKRQKDEKDNFIGSIGVIRDITERKRAELATQKSEQRLKAIIEASMNAIIEVNEEGEIVLFNPSAEDLFGFAAEDILGQKLGVILRKDLDIPHQKRLYRYINKGIGMCGHIGHREEKCFRRKDGSLFIGEVAMSGARANGNRFLVASIHDITQRKEAEKALRRSEENYRILFDATTDALFVHEIKEGGIMGNFIKVNSVACQRLGYSEEELLEMSPADIDDPEFEIDLEGIWKKISRGESVRFEQIHVTKNGERIPVEIHAQGFDWDERMAIISLVRDITERKERVEKLHSLVRQKELLLQEIHHRVKNNLNVISSLLDFESDSTQDKKTLETLRDAKNRIRAMALIHEHLYQSENLAHINFHRYAQILLEEIFYAYGISYNDVTTEINVNNISLPIDKAIPCSLIINEAVSNSLKYAFSEESTGKISIQFYEEDDNICLEIADNGIGLSHDFDLETVKTLGLRIIKMLTRQLEGSVTIDGSDGTTIKINFRKESRY